MPMEQSPAIMRLTARYGDARGLQQGKPSLYLRNPQCSIKSMSISISHFSLTVTYFCSFMMAPLHTHFIL